MPDLRESVKTIFGKVLEIHSDGERSKYLDQACAGDVSLRAELDDLLGAIGRAGNFLGGSPPVATIDPPITEKPGVQIGPYKLLQQIGEGGMGVVFMAEQTEPIQRTVALKIIKPGMDTRQVIARFEAERQAVAMMDHPNIAKVLDAGTTDSGRPYFVMELVKGVPITKYCDEKLLPLRARLGLFVQVCQAVQHAHQKGIIHRDIKPNNVLVAEYDNRAVPKVIDFGVAKATAQRLTEQTMFTEFGQVLGTMEYMSPEQSKFNQLDIDTRSDIYSLGVLLYELLAGSTPFEGKRLHAAAFDEMLRIIREEEPPKPSTRLSSLSLRDRAELRAPSDSASIAANRSVDPKKLASIVRGELDWIVMKALEKDRNHRYETASGFAADIECHLHDQPVQACPPSPAYRFRKFARRNRAVLLTTMLVLAALTLGTVVSTWQAIRATRATRAEREALKVAQANEQAARESAATAEAQRERAEAYFIKARIAIKGVITDAAQGYGKWSQLPVDLRRIIVEDALKFYEGFVDPNNPDPSARYETGYAFWSVGLMHLRLNDLKHAEKYFRQSIDVLDRLVAEFPSVKEYRNQSAWSHVLLSRTLMASNRSDEALQKLRRAAQYYDGLVAEAPVQTSIVSECIRCYWGLSALIGETQEFQAYYDKFAYHLTKSREQWSGSGNLSAEVLNDVAWFLAMAPVRVRAEPQLALDAVKKAVELEPQNADFDNTLGAARYRAGDWDVAVRTLEKAIELRPGERSENQALLAMAHWQLGHQREAREHYDQFVDLMKKNKSDSASVRHLRVEAANLLGVKEEKID
jgi:serine/threonine protein kinase